MDINTKVEDHNDLIHGVRRSLFGNADFPEIARAAGAIPGSNANFYYVPHERALMVNIDHPKLRLTRMFHFMRDHHGNLHKLMHAVMQGPGDEGNLFGTGYKRFAETLPLLQGLGVTHILTSGEGPDVNRNSNGHYSWPRMGFNSELPEKLVAGLTPETKAILDRGGVSDYHSLFAIPGAAEEVKKLGVSAPNLEFDLSPHSPHTKKFWEYHATRSAAESNPRLAPTQNANATNDAAKSAGADAAGTGTASAPSTAQLDRRLARGMNGVKYNRLRRLVEKFAKTLPEYHPEYATQFGVINPSHVTSTVKELTKQLTGATAAERANYGTFLRGRPIPPEYHDWVRGGPADEEGIRIHPTEDEMRERLGGVPTNLQYPQWGRILPTPQEIAAHPKPAEPDWSVAPILADALQDAGMSDETFLKELRNPALTNKFKKYHEGPRTTLERHPALRSLAKDSPEVMQHKWNESLPKQRQFMEEAPFRKDQAALNAGHLPLGFVKKLEKDLRGNPPPGEIWFKNGYNYGSNGRSFYSPPNEKRGRALTHKEIKELLKQQRQQKKEARTAKNTSLQTPNTPEQSARSHNFVERYADEVPGKSRAWTPKFPEFAVSPEQGLYDVPDESGETRRRLRRRLGLYDVPDESGETSWESAPATSHVQGWRTASGGFIRKFYLPFVKAPHQTKTVLSVRFKHKKGGTESEYEYYFPDESVADSYVEELRNAEHPGYVIQNLIRTGVPYKRKYHRMRNVERYAAEKVSPFVKGFRLEHVLRHLANDANAAEHVRHLAKATLETGPEAISPLVDALHETEHPLSQKFNWFNVEHGMHLDNAVGAAIDAIAAREPHANSQTAKLRAYAALRHVQKHEHFLPYDSPYLLEPAKEAYQTVLDSTGSLPTDISKSLDRHNKRLIDETMLNAFPRQSGEYKEIAAKEALEPKGGEAYRRRLRRVAEKYAIQHKADYTFNFTLLNKAVAAFGYKLAAALKSSPERRHVVKTLIANPRLYATRNTGDVVHYPLDPSLSPQSVYPPHANEHAAETYDSLVNDFAKRGLLGERHRDELATLAKAFKEIPVQTPPPVEPKTERRDNSYGGEKPLSFAKQRRSEKYAAIPPAKKIHPELQYTRLGSVLRQHAVADDTIGELSRSILASPHDQPLELTPVHALSDFLQEHPEHPLNSQFNSWETLPQKLHLDQRLKQLMKTEPSFSPVHMRLKSGMNPETQRRVSNMREQLHTEFPWASVKDIDDSVDRRRLQHSRENAENGFDSLEGVNAFANAQHNATATNTLKEYPHTKAEFFTRPRFGDFLSALRRVRSRQQEALRQIAATIHAKSKLKTLSIRDAVHDAPGSAAANVAQSIEHANPAKAKYAAAQYGLLSQSPSLLVFHVGDGNDSVYKIPAKGSGEKLRHQLDAHGLHQRTFLPTKDGYDIILYDRDSKLRDRVVKFAASIGSRVDANRGTGEIIGDENQSVAGEKARASYRSLIRHYETNNGNTNAAGNAVDHGASTAAIANGNAANIGNVAGRATPTDPIGTTAAISDPVYNAAAGSVA
jgi:hypothetical protein